MRLDPSGNLWIEARYIFWGESALAILSADQLPFEPLPGGGFDTGAWRVWSSVHHPIPSPYLNDLEFASDGTVRGAVSLAHDGWIYRQSIRSKRRRSNPERFRQVNKISLRNFE
jgi:hypothetical protein